MSSIGDTPPPSNPIAAEEAARLERINRVTELFLQFVSAPKEKRDEISPLLQRALDQLPFADSPAQIRTLMNRLPTEEAKIEFAAVCAEKTGAALLSAWEASWFGSPDKVWEIFSQTLAKVSSCYFPLSPELFEFLCRHPRKGSKIYDTFIYYYPQKALELAALGHLKKDRLTRVDTKRFFTYLAEHPEYEEAWDELAPHHIEQVLMMDQTFLKRRSIGRPTNILNLPAFQRAFIKHRSVKESLTFFLERKMSSGIHHLMSSSKWLSLPLTERETLVRDLLLHPLVSYGDGDLASLLNAWIDPTRELFLSRIAFLNPEGCSCVASAELRDLTSGLQEAAKRSAEEGATLRAFSEELAAVYGDQTIYRESFALGKAQALFGIRHGKSWEEILFALGIRRHRQSRIQDEHKKFPEDLAEEIGRIRELYMRTPVNTQLGLEAYPGYRARLNAILEGPDLCSFNDGTLGKLITYTYGGVDYNLTRIYETARGVIGWDHLSPPKIADIPSSWFASPLMQRLYELADEIKESSTPIPRTIDALAEFHWLFSNMMPFVRGSPTVMEMLTEALLEHRGLHYSSARTRKRLDCEALSALTLEEYKTWYRGLFAESPAL